MTHESHTALVEAELAPALIAQIEGIVTDASAFNEVAPDHPEGWTAVDIELDELRKARTALNSDDAAEILKLSGESELAQKALLTKIMEPDTVDRLRDIADWAVDSLEDIQEKFPKKEAYVVPEDDDLQTILEKIEEEVDEQWRTIDLETKRELQSAAMDALPGRKQLAVLAGAMEDPSVSNYREVLTLQLEEKTGLNIERLYLTPEQMLRMWAEVRNEKVAEKIIRKVSELDFDAETMMRIGLSLTMVATLAAGPEMANVGESSGAISTTSHPSAQIVKDPGSAVELAPTNHEAEPVATTAGSTANQGTVNSSVSSPLPPNLLNPGHVSEGTPTAPVTPEATSQTPSAAAAPPTTVAAPAPAAAAPSTTEAAPAPPTTVAAPAPHVEAAAPAPAAAAPEAAATPEAVTPPPYTAEKYVIGVLKLLAQKQGIPESATVTQEHINGLLAWGWLEEGDLGNTGYYNLFNSGWDDPSLLATAHRADGVQAFNSFDNGILATVETMLGSNQNRIAKLLSDPSVTAEQFFEGMTYWQRYPGNTYWAQADSDVTLDGVTYTQAGYLEDLQTRYNAVMSNYTQHASILMGNGDAIDKGLYAPATALEYTGTGPVAPPAPPVTTPPTTVATPAPHASGKPPRYKHSKKK